jgi:hypothetical protein
VPDFCFDCWAELRGLHAIHDDPLGGGWEWFICGGCGVHLVDREKRRVCRPGPARTIEATECRACLERLVHREAANDPADAAALLRLVDG